MSCSLINDIPRIESYSYLELGVFNNSNFQLIKCKNKWSVDINGNACFTGTTDEYFYSIEQETRFDIIFIDACHDYEAALSDFNNSIEHCNLWLLMHDMVPPNKKHTRPSACSDSFKILYYLLRETDFKVYPMKKNFGLTLIKMPAKRIRPPESLKSLSYETFIKFLASQKLYSEKEIVDMLKKQHSDSK